MTRGWPWVFVGDQVTVFDIAAGRGYEQAAAILGEDCHGVIERGGWAPYRKFTHVDHQSCVAHLLRRCGELIATSVAGQAKVRDPSTAVVCAPRADCTCHQQGLDPIAVLAQIQRTGAIPAGLDLGLGLASRDAAAIDVDIGGGVAA